MAVTSTRKRIQIEKAALILRGVTHPTRIRILETLRDSEGARLSPSQLTTALPDIALGNIAHHIRELHARGFVVKAGTEPVRGAVRHFYRLSERGERLLALVDDLVKQES